MIGIGKHKLCYTQIRPAPRVTVWEAKLSSELFLHTAAY